MKNEMISMNVIPHHLRDKDQSYQVVIIENITRKPNKIIRGGIIHCKSLSQ